jgi:hypothetical protein
MICIGRLLAETRMPTLASSSIPVPKSWDEFERIVLSAAKLRWGTPDWYPNGRQGQKQDGIDVWGRDAAGRVIGIQCKKAQGGITEAIVLDELEKARGFTPQPAALYVATTSPADAVLQKTIRDLSSKRQAAGESSVDLLFWEDICTDLAKNEDVLFTHYPQLRPRSDRAGDHDRKLYDAFLQDLPSSGVIGFVDHTDMTFPFEMRLLDPLATFLAKSKGPEQAFLTAEIETARQEFIETVKKYLAAVAVDTFPTGSALGWNSVPAEWAHEQPDRYWDTMSRLHDLAGEVVRLHRAVVEISRKCLLA